MPGGSSIALNTGKAAADLSVNNPVYIMGSGFMIFGLVLLAAGAFLIVRMDTVISFLPFVFGLMLLGGCAGKIQTALDLRRVGTQMWLASLLMAGISLVLGIVLLCQPFQSAMVLTRFIGVSITLEGAENLAALPVFERRIHDYYEDNGDIDRR